MKTVTIPTCANPFVVIINGKKYTYPAGKTVEVPDEVAEVIERHEEAKPQPEDAPEEGNGVKSWNDLEDRPFYDEIASVGDTLTWDGSPTDVSIDLGGVFLYKVSGSTPSIDELNSGTATIHNGIADEQYPLEGTIQQLDSNLIGSDVLFVAFEDGTEMNGIVFPEKGIYSFSAGGSFVKSLQIPNYNFTQSVVHCLQEKFLPPRVLEQLKPTPIVRIEIHNGLSTRFSGNFESIMQAYRDRKPLEFVLANTDTGIAMHSNVFATNGTDVLVITFWDGDHRYKVSFDSSGIPSASMGA